MNDMSCNMSTNGKISKFLALSEVRGLDHMSKKINAIKNLANKSTNSLATLFRNERINFKIPYLNVRKR